MIAIPKNVRLRLGPEKFISSGSSVRLTYGIHDLEAEVAGLTVAEIKLAYQDILNLDPAAQGFINGHQVEGGTILRGADRLEWVKEWGKKGSGDELKRIAAALEEIASYQKRIAEHFDPQKRGVVGTPYIAERLGVSVRWINDLIHKGEIPKSCFCPHTGEGKYWRFWKEKIDEWIEKR